MLIQKEKRGTNFNQLLFFLASISSSLKLRRTSSFSDLSSVSRLGREKDELSRFSDKLLESNFCRDLD